MRSSIQENMKILKKLQRDYATLGIQDSSNQLPQEFPFNKSVFFGFFLFGYLIVSQILYIYYVASDFMEYIECIGATFASIIVFVCFTAIIYRKTVLFKSIGNMEKLIDTSEPLFKLLNS